MVDLVMRWYLGTPEDAHRWSPGGCIEPPLSPQEFEARVLEAAAALTPKDLRHWFRHGRRPIKHAGEELAQAITLERPRTLDGVLADLARRPRLAGALPFVDQFGSALSLPPRRLTDRQLPLGGYADVSTRGQPEQLLPSQFALDDLEFVRRYAEHELLYFRREEPYVQVREELVVLLDQGVRTWGDIRLVLAAAVLALGKLAVRRKLPLLLAATSAGGQLFDPLQEPAETINNLVEASDLTANPGLALECVLEEPATSARDVVLLTHPRSLKEDDVSAAARRVGEGVRLFALAVDGHGSAALSEFRHGTPLPLGRFQVDMERRPEQVATVATAGAPDAPWSGDVEPVGFPFRFGVGGGPEVPLFDFDRSGEWILQVGPHGLLHAWRVDWSRWEVLPRPLVNGSVLTTIQAVLGVAGGFVVGGEVQGEWVAAHYDFTARNCRVYRLGGPLKPPIRWQYFAGSHCVVVDARLLRFGLQLSTGEHAFWSECSAEARGNEVALAACRLAAKYPSSPPFLAVASDPLQDPTQPRTLVYSSATGSLRVIAGPFVWDTFTPQMDGQPLLQGGQVLDAMLQTNVLAVRVKQPSGRHFVHLFRGPEGTLLATVPLEERAGVWMLSPDGRRLARHIGQRRIEVRTVGSDDGLTRTPPGKFHSHLEVELGEMWLTIGVGKLTHLIRWDQGRLECHPSQESKNVFLGRKLPSALLAGCSVRAMPGHVPPGARYDPKRFVAAASSNLVAVVDTFGHVVLFENTGELVCMFFTFRTGVAAWLPDGTRACSRSAGLFFNGTATPGADERIGQALLQAWQRGERTVMT
jgi:hypothetical protein